MADSLLFNGTSDYVIMSPGTIVGSGSAFSAVLIVKIASDVAAYRNFLGWNATDSGLPALDTVSGGPLVAYTGGNGVRSAFNCSASEGWMLVGYTQTDPNGAPGNRFHKYVYGGSWFHSDGDTNTLDLLPACTRVVFGVNGDLTNSPFAGNILIGGWWDSALSDGQIEALSASKAAWVAAAPKEAWRFDRTSTISSLIGSSAETSRVGTTLDAGDAPAGWVDGDVLTHRIGALSAVGW